MAEGLSLSLPIRIDEMDGAYALNKTYTQLASQNLRMVILTSPGERMMTPLFGVGARKYIFEPNTPMTRMNIETSIRTQVSRYLPYIILHAVKVEKSQDDTAIQISIRYSIPAANVTADLTIPVTT
jgi:uncharacterized protein